MRTLSCAVCAVLAVWGGLLGGPCGADSITIGAKHCEGVFVIDARDAWRVFRPDGTLVANVSKQRMDVSGVIINRDDPNRAQFLSQDGQASAKKAEPEKPVPLRQIALHGDPEVAAASLAAHEEAMAEFAALRQQQRAWEEQRRREEEIAESNRRALMFAAMSSAYLSSVRSTSDSIPAARSDRTEEAMREVAQATRNLADAQKATAQAVDHQTAAMKVEMSQLRQAQHRK